MATALEELGKLEDFPLTLSFKVPKVAIVPLPSASDAALLLTKLKDKALTLLQPMTLGGVTLRRGSVLQAKRAVKANAVDGKDKGEGAKDEATAVRERLSQISSFPTQLVFELPEEEAAEEKANLGLIKLDELPAMDGHASHGMFGRLGRVAQPSDFTCSRRPGQPKQMPGDLVGVWSTVAAQIRLNSKDLSELLGQLLPAEMTSRILEKKAPLSGESLPQGELPFDITAHPSCVGNDHAQRSLSRWSEDMAFFRSRAASTKAFSLKLKANGQWPAPVALEELHSNLLALKEADEAKVSKSLDLLLQAAGSVEGSSEDRVRFSLLRYSGQEPEAFDGMLCDAWFALVDDAACIDSEVS
ncbi:unnamed protein product [Symbiodinium sp. CCMP2456]|nr:unnamed protein product [Symbiodinium sp. CCMP2456]